MLLQRAELEPGHRKYLLERSFQFNVRKNFPTAGAEYLLCSKSYVKQQDIKMKKEVCPGAQLVKCGTPDFGSGHDLGVVRSSPAFGSVLSWEFAWDSLPLPLSTLS